MKSNLTRSELKLLKSAGITQIQPGIESLSDTTLRVMGKGVSGAHNVALLRWCRELEMEVHWNLLYGFPKEDPAEFVSLHNLLKNLTHLRPPDGCYRIRMDRFSPNLERYQEQGFTEVHAMPSYKHIFDAEDAQIDELAYFFDYSHPHSELLGELTAPLQHFAAQWLSKVKRGEAGELAVQIGEDGEFVLVDSRYNHSASQERLTRLQVAVMLACDAPIGRRRLLSTLESKGLEGGPEALEWLESLGCILTCGNRLITIAEMDAHVRLHNELPASAEPLALNSTAELYQIASA